MKISICLTWSLITFLSTSSSPTWAFGGGGGWDGGGWDGTFPPSIEQEAETLRKDFLQRDLQELLDEQILGTLCLNNSCGGITEDQASQILDRIEESSTNWESKWLARVGALFGLLSLLVSYLAYRQSASNERDIGAMQERLQPSTGSAS